MPAKERPLNQHSLNIHEYLDYKEFLRQLIASYPQEGRGVRKALAEAIRCQVAYVSHVLAGEYHFSIEQAEAAARFFGLAREEAEYLVLLVSYNRSGTEELRHFFRKMLHDRAQAHQQLRTRVRIKETLNPADQATYYSHWFYSANHMALTVPELRTREAIARKLKLYPPQSSGSPRVSCGLRDRPS